MRDDLPTIVVVDDDAEMNKALGRLLNAAGYRAATYPSAEALLAGGTAASAGCLILDVQLPGLSGFELCRYLRGIGIDVPVIFITAHDEASSLQEATESGAISLLLKPFRSQPLLAMIQKCLNREERLP